MWIDSPPANLFICFLCAFVGLCGLSVVVSWARERRVPGTRVCPRCRDDTNTVAGRRCPKCEFEGTSEAEFERRAHDRIAIVVGVVATAIGLALAPAAVWVCRWEGTGYFDGLAMHPLGAGFWGVASFGFALAGWAWRGDRAKGRRRCPKCWYDMSGTHRAGRGNLPGTRHVCPECGHEARNERWLYRTRRRRAALWIGALLVVFGWWGQALPRALREGPIGLVPTTVLVGGIGWLPADLYLASKAQGTSPFAPDPISERLGVGWAWQRRWAAARFRGVAMRSENPQWVGASFRLLQTSGDPSDFSVFTRGLRLLADKSLGVWSERQQAAVDVGLQELYRNVAEGMGGWPNDFPVPTSLMNDLWRTRSAAGAGWARCLLEGFLIPANDETAHLVWECALNSPDETVVYNASSAIMSLVREGSQLLEAWTALSRSSDARERVLATSIATFDRQGLEAVGSRLREMLAEDPDMDVVVGAVEALKERGREHEAEWLGAVETILRGDRIGRWRLASTIVRGPRISDGQFAVVSRACDDPAAIVRGAAVSVLGAFPYYENHLGQYAIGLDAVVARLDDPDARVRALAARAVLGWSKHLGQQFSEQYADAVEKFRSMGVSNAKFDPRAFE